MTTTIFSDNEALLDGIRRGDELVIKHICAQYQHFIINILAQRGARKEEAEDIFMIALEAIHEKLRKSLIILDKGSFKSYLTQICLFQWSKILRRNKHSHVGLIDLVDNINNVVSLEDELLNAERERLLNKKIALISPECRQLIEWIFENKKSALEIAQLLGTTEGNIRKKKYDCKQRLFKMVQSDPLYKELIWSNE